MGVVVFTVAQPPLLMKLFLCVSGRIVHGGDSVLNFQSRYVQSCSQTSSLASEMRLTF